MNVFSFLKSLAFSSSSTLGSASEYGCWGASEGWSVKDRVPGSPKLRAIYNVTGSDPVANQAWAVAPGRKRADDPKFSKQSGLW